jgi:hypothetical protein
MSDENKKGKPLKKEMMVKTKKLGFGYVEGGKKGTSGYWPILAVELPVEDWRKEIVDYLKDLSKKVDIQCSMGKR